METPLQQAMRWKAIWARGTDVFARMCAEALSQDDLVHARRFAKQYAKCRARFWAAFLREIVAQGKEAASDAVDWFGEGMNG